LTLNISWIRKVNETSELVVLSDSRLSCGQAWDANPKILLLPRTDAVLAFAGDTDDAYPLMIQAYNSIKMHEPARIRTMDLPDLKGHLVRIFNHSREFISKLPSGESSPNNPSVAFLLCGYSWRLKQFKIWKLHFDDNIKQFTFRPSTFWKGQNSNKTKLAAFAGDNEVVEEAKRRLIKLLRKKGKLESGNFNMEPFEVMRDLLRENKFPCIGGAIQMVKIYEHSNVMPIGVYWPDKDSGKISFMGRPLMDFERTPWNIIDPDAPNHTFPMPPTS